MIKGTDLSHWNSVVDYNKMANAGIRFGCLKLGQGQLAIDKMFETHRTNFEALNLPWDWYWFCDYRVSGVGNANQAIAKANGRFGRGHPVMDLEYYDGFGPRPDGAHMRQFALDFFGAVELQTTLLAVFYSNRDVINQIMYGISAADKAEFLRHDLWLATHASYGNPSPWPKYRLNQYELDLTQPWSNSTVDLDEFNGTEEEFAAWTGSAPNHPVLTIAEKVDVIEDEARSKGWTLWEV